MQNSIKLYEACRDNDTYTAMKILANGFIPREYINKGDNNTALLWACSNHMYDVALKLIQTKSMNIKRINVHGLTIFDSLQTSKHVHVFDL